MNNFGASCFLVNILGVNISVLINNDEVMAVFSNLEQKIMKITFQKKNRYGCDCRSKSLSSAVQSQHTIFKTKQEMTLR